jgi:HEAT repeat protein
LELAYLQAARLIPHEEGYRRGQVCEEYHKPELAAVEYEKVLELPIKRGEPEPLQRRQAIQRLFELYPVLGQTDKYLALVLRQLEADEYLHDLAWSAEQFKVANQEERFNEWLKKHQDRFTHPLARAQRNWLRKDYPGTVAALAEALKGQATLPAFLGDWNEKFRTLGKEQRRAFLQAVVKALPTDVDARRELLDLDNAYEKAEAIPVFEALLERVTPAPLHWEQQAHFRVRFEYVYQLAYYLMRLYEKHGQDEKLIQLGLRILQAQKPFEDARDYRQHEQPGYPPRECMLDCLFLLLERVKQPKDLQTIKDAVDKTACVPLKNQLARRLAGAKAERLDPTFDQRRKYAGVTVTTQGLPHGVRILSSRDDVLAIAPGGQWVGTSWGLVRYRVKDNGALDVLQVPVGGRVTALCPTPAGLFVGSTAGLFRLDQPDGDKPQLVAITLDETIPAATQWSERSVIHLHWWKQALWIASGGHVLQYDPVHKEVRSLSIPLDANASHPAGPHLFLADGRLWSPRGVFDEKTGEFQPLPVEHQSWHLVGASSRELWAKVLNQSATHYLPALVDRKTLTLHVLSMYSLNELRVGGEDKARVWLMSQWNTFLEYDRASDRLRWLPPVKDDQPVKYEDPSFWFFGRTEGATGYFGRWYTGSRTARWLTAGVSAWQERPDGNLLWGTAGADRAESVNGLFETDAQTGNATHLGSPTGDLCHAHVHPIVFDDEAKRVYVCTAGGVTILSLPDGTVVGRLTAADGLPSNRVADVVRIGRKLYVACTVSNDAVSGLAVLDLDSGLLRRLSTADGLKCNLIRSLRADGAKLHVLYEIGPANGRPFLDDPRAIPVDNGRGLLARTFKSSILDTRTGTFTDGDELPAAPVDTGLGRTLRPLGGTQLVNVTHGGKRYIGGEHGLVILDDPNARVVVERKKEPVKLVFTAQQQARIQADQLELVIAKPEDLARALEDKNAFVREKAVSQVGEMEAEEMAKLVLALRKATSDESPAVRRLAAEVLGKAKTAEAKPLLECLLGDRDRDVRRRAALGLARLGSLPDLKLLEETLRQRTDPSAPFEEIIMALTQNVNREALALLLKYPLVFYDEPEIQTPIDPLGKYLRQHPEAADVLLRAHDPAAGANGRSPVYFAQTVFKSAGAPLLPVLYKALQSDDRVIRSNAARACGTIGDPAAVPHLRKALGLESGLSRASIAWALGQLKAREALPELTALYLETAGSQPPTALGDGFRIGQLNAAQAAQYVQLRNLDQLRSEWEILDAAFRWKPTDPLLYEELLSRDHILNAVREIGLAAAQEFFRQLAASQDAEARRTAADALGEGGKGDRDKDVPLLRGLLHDAERSVRMGAAVSLLLLDQEDAQKPILTWLGSKDVNEKYQIVAHLQRIEDNRRLAFARKALEAVAADGTLPAALRQQAQELLAR